MSNQSRRRAIPTAFGLILLCTVAAGCGAGIGPSVVGSGMARSETRNPGGFTSVQNDTSADVEIAVGGPATEVVVEADDNILPLITTQVHGDRLVISSNASIQTRSPLRVTIRTPRLAGLVINGSGDAGIRGLAGGSFDGTINGSGNLTAAGSVDKLNGQINGSGDLKLKDLTVQSATIAIAGSGDASVDVTNSLNASIAGSGDISYKPAAGLHVQKHVAGSGSIRPM